MAVEAVGDTVVELDPIDAPEVEETDKPAGETLAEESTDQGDDDELVITIGDEKAEAVEAETTKAPEWVRDLRKSNRELVRKQRELEAENARLKGGGGQPQALTLGPRPKIDDAGIEYDQEKFDAAVDAWVERKARVDAEKRQAEVSESQARNAWQVKLDAYNKAKAALKVRDFDEVEEVVKDALNPTQQGIIVNAAADPAKLAYAIGKSPATLKRLAAINDPVKFTWELSKIEDKVKATPRKTAPVPDKVVRGSASPAVSSDKQLDKLREEAVRTGDLTKVNAYKRQMREKQRA